MLLEKVIAEIVLDKRGIHLNFSQKYNTTIERIISKYIDEDKLAEYEQLIKELKVKCEDMELQIHILKSNNAEKSCKRTS